MSSLSAPAMAHKRVLYVGPASSLLTTRGLILERAGYDIVHAATAQAGLQALSRDAFNAVLLGVQLTDEEKSRLAAEIKRLHPSTPVVSFAQGGRRTNEDARIEALSGPDLLLRTLGMLVMRSHGHPEVRSDYYAYVDRERRYVLVSKPLCEVLGYDLEDLIGKHIEDITHASQPAAPKTMFETYLRDGAMEGNYVLKHRSGTPVRIKFRATSLPDGCLVSEMEVLTSEQDRPITHRMP